MTTPTEGLEIAREVLDSEPWLPTPMLPASTLGGRLGLDLWLKREDCSPIGSFKLRGMLVTVARRAAEVGPAGVYAASAGNYGLAVAEACRRSGIRATIMLPEVATPSKVERIRLCGAEVVQYGRDFDAAKDYARSTAEQEGAAFWEDGVVEEMSFGSSTIAAEIIESGPPFDYVLVPLGNGSLLRGIASLFKELSPQTAVVGLVSTASPAMGQAMLGEAWDAHTFVDTAADGLAVREPILPIVEELKPLVDHVWFVREELLLPAVRCLIEMEQVMVEPSAAITAAGLVQHRDRIDGNRVAAVLTGAHIRPDLIPAAMSGPPLLT